MKQINENEQLYSKTLEELWELFPIILTAHQAYWGDWFDEERQNLEHRLPADEIVRISHIGSTAVEGIWAKPIIDILLEVEVNCKISEIKKNILDAGYLLMSETEKRISFNKGYTLHGFAERVFHLHLRFEGDNEELYFRDYLKTHFDVAREYERLKLSLCKSYRHDRDGYTDKKTCFVMKYTEIGKSIYKGRY